VPLCRRAHVAIWGSYALIGVIHVLAVAAEAETLRRLTQPLLAPLLIAAVLTAAPRMQRTTVLTLGGLLAAWAGDSLGQLVPDPSRLIAPVAFLVALLLYAAALAPQWAHNRDPMRLALAIPYGAVVIGLFVACADGAGSQLPLVAAYAVGLGVTAFIAAGGNPLTWVGGTLFLVSSSVLAMDWFLPGAAIPMSDVWVMATYIAGHGLLVAGIVQLLPSRRWTPAQSGAALVIVES